MGCDYYENEYLQYSYTLKGELLHGEININHRKCYISESYVGEEESELALQKALSNVFCKATTRRDHIKMVEDNILKTHNFTYIRPNTETTITKIINSIHPGLEPELDQINKKQIFTNNDVDELVVTESDIESYLKIKNILEPKDFVFNYYSKHESVSDIRRRITTNVNYQNKVRRINKNFILDVEIISIMHKTSRWERT